VAQQLAFEPQLERCVFSPKPRGFATALQAVRRAGAGIEVLAELVEDFVNRDLTRQPLRDVREPFAHQLQRRAAHSHHPQGAPGQITGLVRAAPNRPDDDSRNPGREVTAT
jgi:hypothetical protein